MAIKTFADTSSVSVAYAFSDAYNREELAGKSLDMTVVPYTSEGFSMSKESQQSEAISSSRRIQGTKNTKGSAEGQVTQEFGVTQVFADMLKATLMSDWSDKGDFKEIFDSDIKQYMVWERTIRVNPGDNNLQTQEQYYGTLVNEATLEIGDGDLMTFDITTLSANAEYAETAQGGGRLGGSIACTKVVADGYEIADGSNNINNIVVRNSAGEIVPMTFSNATLTINNNARVQDAIGHVFAAGVAVGMVELSISGEVYYFDNSVMDAHMNNEIMSVEFSVQTRDGRFEFLLPAMTAESPDANSTGQNQDFMQSLTLNAQQGTVDGTPCVVRVRQYGSDQVLAITDVEVTLENDEASVAVTTANVPDGAKVTVMLMGQCGATETVDTEVIAGNAATVPMDIAGFQDTTLTFYVRVEGVDAPVQRLVYNG